MLQPLDLAVFGPLKHWYRHYLTQLELINDSNPIGKASFLECYAAARKKALTATNINAGFRASGIWPKNRNKALNSLQVITVALAPLVTPKKRSRHEDDFVITTPKQGLNLIQLLRGIRTSPSSQRLLHLIGR